MKKIVMLICLCSMMFFTGCTQNKTEKLENKSEENIESSLNTDNKTDQEEAVDKEKTQKNDYVNEVIKQEEVKPKEEIKKKIIVLDPGHADRANLEKELVSPTSKELKIKDGGGAAGVTSKTPEHVVVMNITLKIKKLLEESGYKVIMTKTKASESLGNIERAEVGNKNNADLVIRVHADSAETEKISGASMLVPAPIGNATNISEVSKNYATVILNELINEVGMKNRGVVERRDLTGFNWSKVPVILVETGFLSNLNEDKLLNTDEYQSKIAIGLFKGIKKAVN